MGGREGGREGVGRKGGKEAGGREGERKPQWTSIVILVQSETCYNRIDLHQLTSMDSNFSLRKTVKDVA